MLRIPSDALALFDYQREGVQFALRHEGKVLIADEMGLGKTVQAICTALCYTADWPVLVVVPASLIDNWGLELRKWLSLAGVPEPASLVHLAKTGTRCEGTPSAAFHGLPLAFHGLPLAFHGLPLAFR